MRLGENLSTLLEWLHLEALGIRVALWISLVSLDGCRHLDGLVKRELLSGGRWLSSALIVLIVRGSWPFPGGELKGTLENCSWLVWSSSYVGCAAPYWGFGVWCQLAREPSSEWIATTGTSLLASKWTSEEKSLCLDYLLSIHSLVTSHGCIPLYHSLVFHYTFTWIKIGIVKTR